jgi:hypothetical protein
MKERRERRESVQEGEETVRREEKRRRKGKKGSQFSTNNGKRTRRGTHAPELARIAHGAVAQPPITAVMSCPRVMSTHLGKSVTKSFALEIELAVMLAAIPASIHAIAANAIAARLSHWFMMSNGLQSASALSRL